MNYSNFLEAALTFINNKEDSDLYCKYSNINHPCDKYRNSSDHEEYESYYKEFNLKMNEFFQDNNFLAITYETGGYRGGDCWGGRATRYEVEERPEFEDFYKFLEKAAPSLTYLQVKNIEFEFILETDGDDYADYYGNGIDYETKYVCIKDLYKYLCENNLM